MTKNFLKIVLAAAGTAVLSSSLMAQSSVTYTQGDFLLGFRATGGTGAASNVLVDIGAGSTFLNSSTPVVFNLSNLFSTLNGVFGSNWSTRSDLFWSVAGADASSSSTIYISDPTTPGHDAAPWTGLGTANQTGVRNKINTEGGLPNTAGYNFYTGNSNPFGAGPAVIEGNGDNSSYGSYHPGGANAGPAPGISYGFFSPTIEGTFANGTTGVTLDLIKLTSATGLGNNGTDLGDFSLSSNGVLTWTPDVFEAVPEPSTYAMFAMGAMLLSGMMVLRRRRSA